MYVGWAAWLTKETRPDARRSALRGVVYVVVDNHHRVDCTAEVRLGSHLALRGEVVSEVQLVEDTGVVRLHPLLCVLFQNLLAGRDDV